MVRPKSPAAFSFLLIVLLGSFPGPVPADDVPGSLLPATGGYPSLYPLPGPVSPEGRPLRSWPGGLPPPSVSGPPAGRAGLRIEGVDRPLSEFYLARYSSPAGIRWLNQVMRDAAPWLPFIRAEISRRDLPPELAYLPVIESAYKPGAVSRSGAAGIWQFMRNSVAPFGIQIVSGIDERLDFWKSTLGALQKLEDNYRETGDWALALSAYNMGLGGLRRIMRQSGIRDYWELSERNLFNAETVHYVPKFLAAAWMLSNPRRYGLDPDWSEDPRWTRVRAPGPVDLDRLAGAAGIDRELFRLANAEYTQGVVPGGPARFLKVRAGDADAVEAALAEMGESLRPSPRVHTVRRGETLWGLGRIYRMTAEALAEANNMGVNDVLHEGRTLNIPIMEME